jgi:hypothetical protein
MLQVSAELGNSYNDVIAAQDVALYGGLCALASFDRAELKRSIVENISFRELLELNPEVSAHLLTSVPHPLKQPLSVATSAWPAACGWICCCRAQKGR